MTQKIVKFVISVLICEAAGFVGSFFTAPAIPTWYAQLEKPYFSPPNWLFAPVWTFLFFLMGVSLFLIWSREKQGKNIKPAIFVFTIQFLLNILWSLAFFGLQSPFYGLVVIILLWFAILFTIFKFYPVSRGAAYLLVPYIIWVSFAGVLNLSILMLN